MKQETLDSLKLLDWDEVRDHYRDLLTADQLLRLQKWHEKNHIQEATEYLDLFNTEARKKQVTIDDLRKQLEQKGIIEKKG